MPQLPLTRAAIGALAGLVLTAIGGYAGLVWPMSREVSRLEEELQALSRQATAASTSVSPVTDIERASWQQIEGRVRDRFVMPDDQFELLVEMAQLARASGMLVVDAQLEGAPGPAPTASATFAVPPPPTLAPNPGVIRLSVRHQYPALVDFLDRLATTTTYVAVQGVDVRRVDNLLHSEIRLVSFRWAQTP
jgi:hypothetical protein